MSRIRPIAAMEILPRRLLHDCRSNCSVSRGKAIIWGIGQKLPGIASDDRVFHPDGHSLGTVPPFPDEIGFRNALRMDGNS